MEIPLYKALKDVGIEDAQAEKVVHALDERMKEQTNSGIHAVRADIAAFRGEVRGEITALRSELSRIEAEIVKVDSKVDKVESKVGHKIDSIRWMIGVLVPVCAIIVTATIAFITHH